MYVSYVFGSPIQDTYLLLIVNATRIMATITQIYCSISLSVAATFAIFFCKNITHIELCMGSVMGVVYVLWFSVLLPI